MQELPAELCHPSPQVLQAFEEIPLCSVLEQIQEKHNLEKVKKVSFVGHQLAVLCSLGVRNLHSVALWGSCSEKKTGMFLKAENRWRCCLSPF